MTARRKPPKSDGPSLPPSASLTVIRSPDGPEFQVSGVPCTTTAALSVARWLDALYRQLGVPAPGPDTIPGGSPVEVIDDDWAEEGGPKRSKRVGF